MIILYLILFLIAFPFFCGFILFPITNAGVRTFLLKIISVCLIIATLILLFYSFKQERYFFNFELPYLNLTLYLIELLFFIYLIIKCFKYKKIGTAILTFIQFSLVSFFNFRYEPFVKVENSIFIDRFTIVMALIVGIIGSLICIYTIGYMREFHERHKEIKDNRRFMAFTLCLFISAMFGIIFSNNLIWLNFFWEITTICSFILIGYTKKKEAVDNSFKALFLNLFGGIAITIGIIFLFTRFNIVELDKLLSLENNLSMQSKDGIIIITLIAILLCFAGLIKSAQFPFSGWLLGAMVAPTPVSALLHSSTMVKAGVYLIIRIIPVFSGSLSANCIALIGGITFLIGSLIAVSQSNAKKVLAYSTIANLGLIVACAGVGSFETIAAAILLIIFHAIAKSVLFLCVGSVEHKLGSRDIETWDWLILKIPKIAAPMVIGIGGMFLPPFGMLLSKWVVLGAFADSHLIISPLLIASLAFGSAFNLFFWTKWLGKIISTLKTQTPMREKIPLEETIIIWIIAIMTIGVCLSYPLLIKYLIEPYLQTSYLTEFFSKNSIILSIMFLIILVLPLSILLIIKKAKQILPYLSGRNSNETVIEKQGNYFYVSDNTFDASMGKIRLVTLKNYYLEDMIKEKKIFVMTQIVTLVLVIMTFIGSFV